MSHPAKQGLVQGFSVYVDTLFVCSATAMMLLITGQYNVEAACSDSQDIKQCDASCDLVPLLRDTACR